MNPEPPPADQVSIENVSHVLLDIEGTTCPVSFVAETLFPYAAAHLPAFVERKAGDPSVAALLQDAREAWAQDDDQTARELHGQAGADVVSYLSLLIRQARKLTPLKTLQGLIWEAGYAGGELRAPLFDDVAEALAAWKQQGLVLAVYSSGSVQAQQQLYGHSIQGDLREHFSYWFDTRTGPKQDSLSYRRIAETMHVEPERVLFISDALAECEAATQAGMQAVFSARPGNPGLDPGPLTAVSDYRKLTIAALP